MTIELTTLAFSIVLGLVQLVLVAQGKNRQLGYFGRRVRAMSRDRLLPAFRVGSTGRFRETSRSSPPPC